MHWRRRCGLALGLLWAALCPDPLLAADLADLSQILRELGTTATVLHVGAHPDDEDNVLLAYLARQRGVRTVYLSLTRGEGGQNSIGGETGPALGLLRTLELLGAREVDGAEQTFGACYDFGFSHSAEETLAKWGEREALGDIVLALRRYRPDVVISRFAGDTGDGHGHHQAVGLLVRRAFRAAADPAEYPEHAAAGLQPWQASRLYVDRGPLEGADCQLDVSTWLLPWGATPAGLGARARSRHHSQDMGTAEALAPAPVRMKLIDSIDQADPAADLLAGLDVSLPRLAGEDGLARTLLASAADEIAAASTGLPGLEPSGRGLRVRLGTILDHLRRASARLEDSAAAPPTADQADRTARLRWAIELAEEALTIAAGLRFEARVDRAELQPGESATVTLRVLDAPGLRLQGARFELRGAPGWQVGAAQTVGPGHVTYTVTAPTGPVSPRPSWLARTRVGERYDQPDVAWRGLALDPPLLEASVVGLLDETPLHLTRAVEHVALDPIRGERRSAPTLGPAVTGAPLDSVLLHAPGRPAPAPRVRLRGGAELSAVAEIQPDGTLAVPGQAAPLLTRRALDYGHVPPFVWYEPARIITTELDVAVQPGLRLGVVPGPQDETVAALRRLGLQPRIIDAEALASADFAGLQTIVIGARAYEVDTALVEANEALLAWARAGGNLVVFYQKYPWLDAGLAPYPLTFARPHDRVTVEQAPVELLAPTHRLLTTPNAIGADDFAGWVQERGLYFAHTWDPAYTPLLASADPGDAPLQGGLLAADLGRGRYTYCAYALFRQWPAGVAGSYRLLANLVQTGE